MPMTDDLFVEADGSVLRVTFNRPAQHNAMTWAMYDGLAQACRRANDDPHIRVLVLRGAGNRAFVAGTDISQFEEFKDAEAGLAYERRTVEILDTLARVTVPTLAVVSGYCVGGGFSIAALCDLRIAAAGSQFGIPVARTLGNCLSMPVYALLVDLLGSARALDMLLRARLVDAEELRQAGFLSEVCEPSELDARAEEIVEQLTSHAPLSMWAAKEAVRRLRTSGIPDGEDIIERVYGSADFRAGVRAFLAKERPTWTGS